jgi:hypothetical protein
MDLASSIDNSPFSIDAHLTLNETDILRAFEVADPDEQLFFDVWGPNFKDQPVSKRLALLARVAELAEQAEAATLNLEEVAVEPKP